MFVKWRKDLGISRHNIYEAGHDYPLSDGGKPLRTGPFL